MPNTKRKYNTGDIVLCKRYTIENAFAPTSEYSDAMGFEPMINDRYFNRKAIITQTSKECLDTTLGMCYDGKGHEDKDEYAIRFLDNNEFLAWVYGSELILLKRGDDNGDKDN